MDNLNLIESIKSQHEDVYKLIFKDSDVLEVSYIRKNDGKDILCVPSQTSCNLGCTFCHLTGLGIKAKNLNADRILDLIEASLKFQEPANETLLISFMNAGEPLMNATNVIQTALDLKYSEHYKNLQDKYKTIRFAVSTILPSRNKFNHFKESVIKHNLPFKLHWSLHSLNSIARKSLMPAASSIADGLAMIEEYISETGNPAEIHYTLIDDVNDTQEDLDRFEKFVGRSATIKILQFSEKNGDMKGSKNTQFFKKGLEDRGFTVEVYDPPGRDVSASCGMFILDQYSK